MLLHLFLAHSETQTQVGERTKRATLSQSTQGEGAARRSFDSGSYQYR